MTGTKGKTTTSSLTAAILAADPAHPVILGGNIGLPLIERLAELTPSHRVVDELSELQLPTLSRGHDRRGLHERHRGPSRPARVARGVPAGQAPPGRAGRSGRGARPQRRGPGRRGVCRVRPAPASSATDVRPRPRAVSAWSTAGSSPTAWPALRRAEPVGGRPDHARRRARDPGRPQRLECARGHRGRACSSASSPSAIRAAATAFTGVEHRLEPVATIDGVRFINDSQGTQPDAVIAALRAFDPPIVLIAGGRAKGIDLAALAPVVAERAYAAVLIGESGPDLEAEFRAAGLARTERAPDLETAVRGPTRSPVRHAPPPARPRATVLLSPAAASFDMFVDYAARGRAFKDAVAALRRDPHRGRGPVNLNPPIPRLERLRRDGGRPAPEREEPSRPLDRTTANRTPVKSRTGAVRRERHQADYVILVVVVALTAVGILMVYSSSALKGYLSQNADTFATVGPQIQWAVLGFIAMAAMMRVDYRYLRLASVPMYIVAIVLLVLVFVPALNIEVGGSARWLKLPMLPAIHPAEFAKLALVVYLAHWFAKRGRKVRGFWAGTVPFLIIVLPVIALVFKEPDLGTTMVITLTAFTMFFVAGRQPDPPGGHGLGGARWRWSWSVCAATSSTGSGSGRTHGSIASATASTPSRGCWRSASVGCSGPASARARSSSRTRSTTSSSPRSARSSG